VEGPGGGVKVGTESYETTAVADGRQRPPTEAEVAAIYRDYVQPRLPWLGPVPVRALSCLYTCTWDNRFVIDRHPEHDRVLIVSPCSGHGFKHSPAIGEAVARWLTEGLASGDVDLSPFRLAGAHRPRPPAVDARIDR
jgi:sarcosine oxidase